MSLQIDKLGAIVPSFGFGFTEGKVFALPNLHHLLVDIHHDSHIIRPAMVAILERQDYLYDINVRVIMQA